MKSILTAITLLSILSLLGCRTTDIYQSQGIVIPSGLTSREVQEAIVRAVESREGWFLNDKAEGKVRAMLAVRLHKATVDILYDSKLVKTELISSENLKQSEGMIHKNFNTWVQLLERDILLSLNEAKVK